VAALVNSSGYLEIAVRGSSAADALQLRRGDGIEVRPRD
jgi:S-adenosylmethionine hydrolase